MKREILTADQMARVDHAALAAGPLDGIGLMTRAGMAVAKIVLERFGSAGQFAVLCGPGGNGGDGYIVAAMLRHSGASVAVFHDGLPKDGADARLALSRCAVEPRPLEEFRPMPETLVVDALYGAGLSRPVGDSVVRAIVRATQAGSTVVSVDLPSGVSGASGAILGHAFKAALTVTFVRRKPGHLLLPGREWCGEVVVAEIGIGDAIVLSVQANCFENAPSLWLAAFPRPEIDTHKYARGHVAVFSGGPTATGAARLSAMAAARTGAGAVTVLSPRDALGVNAAHLTSIMLRQADSTDDAAAFMDQRRVAALVYGPGLAAEAATGRFLLELLDQIEGAPGIVLDASALTSLAGMRDDAFRALGARTAYPVLTPHEGEFRKLFPDLTAQTMPSKLDRARAAAMRSNAVQVYKGPDTVIASPDGRAAINANGASWLATAGSGDVLSGIIGGLLAQKMPAFEAACAGVWMHAKAATWFGPGLIAEDLPSALPPVLRDLYGHG